MASRYDHLAPEKYDAIHRSLLTGLLSNVGQKSEAYEYTGARGVKFNIFPGSCQFTKKPQWLMAAELVETTKLYARTVAKIRPDWIERIGEHLLKRTYADPHYNPATAHVTAVEKVTLYGLVLVAARPVHYGPIDPVLSRQLFIMQALVEGEYTADAPYRRHNAKLIDDIQRLEAKSRQKDVLVSAQVRYDFYDARIPAGIHNGPLFEKWRRQAERDHPKLLFMTRRDLMLHSATDVTAELFPDHLTVQGLNIPIEYHFEPGHPADGVTATIPLPVLNQLPTDRFEWLVPGLIKEKVTALIKSLPKDLRVNFVPAPEYAEAAAAALKPGDDAVALTDSLAYWLGKQRGVVVPREAFDPSSLLDHLHMNFKVVDEAKKVLATGRNLDDLRKRLGVQVKATFAQVPHPQFHRDDLTKWDFGDLPASVQIKRHGMTLTAYPALVDNGDSVSLRLLDAPESARASHLAGVRKLLLIELRDEIRYVASAIPGIRDMCLHYATLGPCQDLRDDVMGKAINRAFLYDADVRTGMEYELRKNAGRRHRLLDLVRDVSALAGPILQTYHEAALLLQRPPIPAWVPSVADVKNQLAHLLFKGFLTATPDERLQHFPRYLKAVQLRLQKLATTGHTKDQQKLAELQPFWQAYVDRARRNREQNIIDAALCEFRWMLEEYRVSLFAQELRAAIPISAPRLEKQWALVRK